MEGARVELLPVLRVDVVAWSAGVLSWDVDVLAREPPGGFGEEWQLFSEELDALLSQVG